MVSDSSSNGSDITLRDLLVHLQGLGIRMDSMEKMMRIMQDDINIIKIDIVHMKEDIRVTKTQTHFMKSGIQNLDERLDTIELIPSILEYIKKT